MNEHETPESGRLAARLGLARAALLWERLWPSLFPAMLVVGIFLILAFADVLPSLPGWAHVVVLVVFAGALTWALLSAVRGFVVPGLAAARRRLERASGLDHRPLTALSDRLAGGGDPAGAALWDEHRARMAAAARRLRVGVPAAGLARRDPWGLRAALALVLVIVLVDAGDQSGARLLRAFEPSFAASAAAPPPGVDVWLTPPEYTGMAPLFLQHDRQNETVAVPVGSKLLGQVSGVGDLPQLKIDQKALDFARIDAKNFKIGTVIDHGSRIAVEEGGTTLAAWPITVIPDEPPRVTFGKKPEKTSRAALRLEYDASDDYGVESVHAVIRRKGGNPKEKIDLELPLPGQHLKEAKNASFHDLTPHPWAGLPVEIRLVATDALGQTGESEPFSMVLPERTFHNPVARALIEQRKLLTQHPDQRDVVAETLSDLSAQTGLYHEDMVVFLALRTAAARLTLDETGASVPPIQQLLWDTALRIEDGGLTLAQRQLRELQQKLQDALARNAPDSEIERLMNQLQQAMDQYLRSMAENMQRMDPSQLRQQPVDPSRMVTRQDLQKMLDRARELARSGAKEAARDLLAQLQEMLENLRAARPGDMQARNSQAQQMMRSMRDMMRQQQGLLDRSFRASRNGQQQQPGQQMGPQGQMGQQQGQQMDMSGAAQQQEALRRQLGEMMRRLGEGGDIPQPFGRAERAMRGAAKALDENQPGDAVGPQTEALDQLQQAMRDLSNRMQQAGQGQGGAEDGQGGERSRRVDRDPLGRPLSGNGSYDQGDVKIPEEGELQKSRQILDELRRRAGERSRPELERNYIDRLLKRF